MNFRGNAVEIVLTSVVVAIAVVAVVAVTTSATVPVSIVLIPKTTQLHIILHEVIVKVDEYLCCSGRAACSGGSQAADLRCLPCCTSRQAPVLPYDPTQQILLSRSTGPRQEA